MILIFLFIFSIQLFSESITIPKGASAKWVANHLKQHGIINYSTQFYAYLRLKKLDAAIHSGEFNIPADASFASIADIITGKVAQFQPVTIPEGMTLGEIAHELTTEGIISSPNAFLASIKRLAPIELGKHPELSVLNPNHFEGILFPDTYYFSKGSSHLVILQTFIDRFKAMIYQTYAKANRPPLNFYDTLILASIIEKEAGTVNEMGIISGVFHNRLKKNMLLASCPTVGYAMGQPRKKYLSYKDLKFKSPYNTYIHRGLPPTPIAAPGKQAFLAALNPEQTPYLYFVAKNNGTGTHVLSKTLKDHLEAQQRILQQ